MKINQNTNFGTHNTSKRTGKIQYIVIHYVGATGDAKANINYYNQRNVTNASADFYVGHAGDVWQYNPNPESRYCWAVGGKKQSSYGGKLYGTAKNANCVSIEMCVKNAGNKSANSADWMLADATYNATVELTKYLMSKYGIDANHVIRHFDVNGKACPGIIGWNVFPGNNENKWSQFKNDIISSGAQKPTATPGYKYKVGDNVVVSSHYTGANDGFDKAVAVNPWLNMNILNVVEGAKNPYYTNFNSYCNDGDIRGYAQTTTESKPQQKDTVKFSQHVKDLQWALNQDGITDSNGNKLAEDGVWGSNTQSAVLKVLLSTKTIQKYTNTTSWVQCRIGSEVDGLFGNNMKNAVINFQKSKGLTADGIVGKNTIMALVKMFV